MEEVVHLCSTESAGDPDVRLTGGARLTPPSPCLLPCLPPLPTVSLYFSNSLCIGVGREHFIFIIWFREGPEALSHCMVSMETDLFRGLGVVRWWWGRGKHIVKSGSTSVAGVGSTPVKGAGERLGKALGAAREGLLIPPIGVSHQELLISPVALGRLLLLPSV